MGRAVTKRSRALSRPLLLEPWAKLALTSQEASPSSRDLNRAEEVFAMLHPHSPFKP